MPPHPINIYADRQRVNESLQKRERSKTTELRPSNEDLGKSPANLLIVWQAACAPAPFSSPSIPFTPVIQMHPDQTVWAFTCGPLCMSAAPSVQPDHFIIYSAMIMYLAQEALTAAGKPITAMQTFNNTDSLINYSKGHTQDETMKDSFLNPEDLNQKEKQKLQSVRGEITASSSTVCSKLKSLVQVIL